MVVWFIGFLLIPLVMSMDSSSSIDRFQSCHREDCILIQCYFPIEEFRDATQQELSRFQSFIERQQLFISYHLCADLSTENMDEVGACIYGVMFKLYQYDANMTLHQRIHIQRVEILEQSMAVVMDMISTVLYRLQTIEHSDELRSLLDTVNDEDIVIINTEALDTRAHLSASQMILNYGQWFTFIYHHDVKDKECRYRIYSMERESICASEHNILKELEKLVSKRPSQLNAVHSYADLSHLNAFRRILPTLFDIHSGSSNPVSFSDEIPMIIVDISAFSTMDIENHVILHGPYPFYLFWSPKKHRLQRLGDRPSVALIEALLTDEQDQADRRNDYDMFDDEVRYYADQLSPIEIHPKVVFLKTDRDYQSIRNQSPPMAIMFTLKWDSTSKLARHTFHRLAAELVGFISMIDIDCFDWTDICEQESIIEWPTLMIIAKDGTKTIYRGSTDYYQMGLFLFRMTMVQPFFIDEQVNLQSVENLLKRQRVIVTAHIAEGDRSFLLKSYQTLVDIFRENEHIFFAYQFVSESSSLVIKQQMGDLNSLFEPKTTVHLFDSNINHWKELLTEVLRFPVVPFDPLEMMQSTSRVFVAASRSQLETMKDQLRSFIDADSRMLWIDTNSPWILLINDYGDIAYPAIICLDFSTGHVYVSSALNNIQAWFEAIGKQSIQPFYQLTAPEVNDGPSQPAIDFNRQNEDLELLEEYHLIHETSEKLNEHGLGFDPNGLPVDMNI